MNTVNGYQQRFLSHGKTLSRLPRRVALCLIAAAALFPGAPVVTNVLNGASYGGVLAPGTWAAIFGTGLATSAATATSVPLATTLGSVMVTFGGVAAPLYYVSPNQINAVIPFTVAIPKTSGSTVPVVVTVGSTASAAFNVMLSADAPAIFT